MRHTKACSGELMPDGSGTPCDCSGAEGAGVSVEAYMCWDESNTDEDGAERYEAHSSEHAAEIFAADELNNSGGDMSSPIEARVRCPDGSLEIYDVTVDYEPVFSATKREIVPAPAGETNRA